MLGTHSDLATHGMSKGQPGCVRRFCGPAPLSIPHSRGWIDAIASFLEYSLCTLICKSSTRFLRCYRRKRTSWAGGMRVAVLSTHGIMLVVVTIVIVNGRCKTIQPPSPFPAIPMPLVLV